MAKTEPQEIPDDTDLTQYGEHLPDEEEAQFRNRTRVEIGETDVSLILGRVGAEEAALLVTKAPRPWATVRFVKAGTLRAKGFIVRHTPSKRNTKHVSVLPPLLGREPVEWDDDLAKVFDGCFTESEGGGTHA